MQNVSLRLGWLVACFREVCLFPFSPSRELRGQDRLCFFFTFFARPRGGGDHPNGADVALRLHVC